MVSPAEEAVKPPFCNIGTIYARAPVFGPIKSFDSLNVFRKIK